TFQPGPRHHDAHLAIDRLACTAVPGAAARDRRGHVVLRRQLAAVPAGELVVALVWRIFREPNLVRRAGDLVVAWGSMEHPGDGARHRGGLWSRPWTLAWPCAARGQLHRPDHRSDDRAGCSHVFRPGAYWPHRHHGRAAHRTHG